MKGLVLASLVLVRRGKEGGKEGRPPSFMSPIRPPPRPPARNLVNGQDERERERV